MPCNMNNNYKHTERNRLMYKTLEVHLVIMEKSGFEIFIHFLITTRDQTGHETDKTL